METNRFILARHIGVDALMCFTVAFMGFKSRAIMKDMIDAGLRRRPNTMPEAGYETRMFTYHPEAQRILLFFFAYQVAYQVESWNERMHTRCFWWRPTASSLLGTLG